MTNSARLRFLALAVVIALLSPAPACQWIKEVTGGASKEEAAIEKPPPPLPGPLPPKDILPAEEPWVSVAFLDAGLSSLVKAESSQARRTPSGRLEAWVLLRNLGSSPLNLEGRVMFFDIKRRPVGEPSAWARVFLPPHGMYTYRGQSLEVQGPELYRIEIRGGR